MFSGSITALVTPFDLDGRFVESAYRELVEWQIEEGSAGLVACGTTGEHSTMTSEEHFRIVRICADQASGRVPVLAGAGSNDTKTATGNIKAAMDAGADAALMMAPYYNRPNQDGIRRHFEFVASSCSLPIMLYNVPTRTGVDISVETMAALARDVPSIIGVKDASGLLQRVSAQRASCGEGFIQICGNDDVALAFRAHGGRGCISVTSNVAPRLCAEFQAACSAGDFASALGYQDRLFPLHASMFGDASPGPVNYALARLHPRWPLALRLPMTEPDVSSCRAIDAAMVAAGLVDTFN